LYFIHSFSCFCFQKHTQHIQKDDGTRIPEPLFLGRRFAQNGDFNRIFNSGGAGYILNQASLKILANNALDNIKCQPHLKGFWEDVQVASCLRKVDRSVLSSYSLNSNNHYHHHHHQNNMNVVPFDTRDMTGRERFHPFSPGNHYSYKINHQNPDWYAKYSIDLKEGIDCCSDYSISFHYVKPLLMPKIHALLYDCRE